MKKLSIENPINRYSLGMFTEGVKSKTDDSLEIYIQPGSPGKDKESNLLPRRRVASP